MKKYKGTVLLVEDDFSHRRLYHQILELENYFVFSFPYFNRDLEDYINDEFGLKCCDVNVVM